MKYEQFLQRLKDVRKSKKWTMKRVAEVLEISSSTVSMWESGKLSLRMKDYFLLCELYDIQPKDLFFENETAKRQEK